MTSKLRLDDANHFTPHLFLLFPGTAGVEVNQKKNGEGAFWVEGSQVKTQRGERTLVQRGG